MFNSWKVKFSIILRLIIYFIWLSDRLCCNKKIIFFYINVWLDSPLLYHSNLGICHNLVETKMLAARDWINVAAERSLISAITQLAQFRPQWESKVPELCARLFFFFANTSLPSIFCHLTSFGCVRGEDGEKLEGLAWRTTGRRLAALAYWIFMTIFQPTYACTMILSLKKDEIKSERRTCDSKSPIF